MQLKLVREEVNGKPKDVTIEKLLEDAKAKRPCIFYFDRTNVHKDLISMVEHIEKAKMSVYLREVKYGLDDNDYMYEVHIV
jgi:hypothetical protein